MDKIICVGKNYAEHATELGDAVPNEPTYFLKPPSALFTAGGGAGRVSWPTTTPVHHEVELVFRIAGGPRAWTYSHYTVGLDLTLRDIQRGLKAAGLPWEKSKVFENAAVVGPFLETNAHPDLLEVPFSLEVNGQIRQRGFGRDMRWSPSELLGDLQRWFPLRAGDLVFTGTPAGVGALAVGDLLRVRGGAVDYSLTVAAP